MCSFFQRVQTIRSALLAWTDLVVELKWRTLPVVKENISLIFGFFFFFKFNIKFEKGRRALKLRCKNIYFNNVAFIGVKLSPVWGRQSVRRPFSTLIACFSSSANTAPLQVYVSITLLLHINIIAWLYFQGIIVPWYADMIACPVVTLCWMYCTRKRWYNQVTSYIG